MTEVELFARQGQENKIKLKTQFFFARLIVPLAGWPCFCLVKIFGLTVGLAISRVESIDGKIAVGFSGCSLSKMETSFQRCYTADTNSQVFSFSR